MKRNEECDLTEDIDDFCLNSHFAISNIIAVIVVVVMLASVAFDGHSMVALTNTFQTRSSHIANLCML